MRFRPCIDLHNGKVKQIVGGTLSDKETQGLVTNFETELSAAHYAGMYRKDSLHGGHVIMLGPGNESAAREALKAFPGGFHIGGGINPENALSYLNAGASHVIATSYVFRDGKINWENLEKLTATVGSKCIVLDLSCRNMDGKYLVATDRWQKISSEEITETLLLTLEPFCDEFLVHAADVEGKQQGVDVQLVELLGQISPLSVTYAGGVRSVDDLELIRKKGQGRVDATVGSALDIFGGNLKYEDVVAWHHRQQ